MWPIFCCSTNLFTGAVVAFPEFVGLSSLHSFFTLGFSKDVKTLAASEPTAAKLNALVASLAAF